MELVAYGDINKFGVDSIRVYWEITEKCNFRCHYCNYVTMNQRTPTDDKMKEIISFINNLSENRNIEAIVITAAEPTTIPNIHEYTELLTKSVKNDTKIKIYSNMSAPISTYRKMIDSVIKNGNRVYIFPSFHKEFIDSHKFFDKIIKIQSEYENEDKFSFEEAAFMVHSEECIELAKEIHSTPKYKNLMFVTEPIREIYDHVDQVCEDMKIYREKSLVGIYKDGDEYKYKYDTPNHPFMKGFKRWICNCWYSNIHISYDGYLSPCSILRFYNDLSIKDDISDRKYIICSEPVCFCNYAIPKYKMLEYKKLRNWTKDDILKLEKIDG